MSDSPKSDKVTIHDDTLCPVEQQKAFLEGFEAAAYCYSEFPKQVDHYAAQSLRDWLKGKEAGGNADGS